jgi:hypothetical protein
VAGKAAFAAITLLDSILKLLNYQVTQIYPITTQLPNLLTSFPLSSITSLHLVMGSAVRIRHCPATVFAENLKRQATGKVPICAPIWREWAR